MSLLLSAAHNTQTGISLSPFKLVLIVVLLLLAAFVVGLVVLAVRGGRTGRIVAATLAVVLIGVPLLLFVSLATSRVQTMRDVGQHETTQDAALTSLPRVEERLLREAPAPPRDAEVIVARVDGPASPLESATHWRPAADLLPDAAADLYPSQRDAEEALAADLVRGYTTGKPITITLIDKDVKDPEQAHRGLAQAIRRRGAACDFNDKVRGSSSQHELAYVNVSYTPPTERFPLGTLTASVPDRFEIEFRFVDKPWLTDLAAQRELRDQPDLLVGVGSGLEATEADALTAALRAAALQLAPRLADARPRGAYDPSIQHVVLDTVVRRLRQIDGLEDRFVQSLKRNYGSVHRAAVLVNATPDFITELYGGNQHAWTSLPPEQQYAAAVSGAATPVSPAPGTRRFAYPPPPAPAPQPSALPTAVSRVAGLGLLTLLTLLIYLGLDRWTRGYRPRGLLVAAVVVILGGALLLSMVGRLAVATNPATIIRHPNGSISG